MSPVSTSYRAVAAIEIRIITDDWLTVGECWTSVATVSKKLPRATHLPFSRTKLPCASYFGVTNRWEGMTFYCSSSLNDSKHAGEIAPTSMICCTSFRIALMTASLRGRQLASKL